LPRARIESCGKWGDPLADAGDKPLAGKRVVITRAPEQSVELIAAFDGRGAQILLLPVVSFAPPEDWAVVDQHLRRVGEFDAILFLSANAARYVLGRAKSLGVALQRGGAKPLLVAAVGPGTARAAEEQGIRADYVAREHTGRALAAELRDRIAGREVLLPRSDRGDDSVPHALRDAGALVTEFVAYRNLLPPKVDAEIVKRVVNAEVDVVLFASPSAVHNFCVLLGGAERKDLAGRIAFAAIGSTTAEAMRDRGLPVTIRATESSAEAVAAAVAEHFARA
jgi:uroporphyrinogen-III synthase